MSITVEKTNRLKMFKNDSADKEQTFTLYLNIEGVQYVGQVYKQQSKKSGVVYYTGPLQNIEED